MLFHVGGGSRSTGGSGVKRFGFLERNERINDTALIGAGVGDLTRGLRELSLRALHGGDGGVLGCVHAVRLAVKTRPMPVKVEASLNDQLHHSSKL